MSFIQEERDNITQQENNTAQQRDNSDGTTATSRDLK